MAQKLMPGGYLYCVTDIEEYASFAKASLDACSLLENQYEDFAPFNHGVRKLDLKPCKRCWESTFRALLQEELAV